MAITKLTPQDIALAQLTKAMSLYMKGEDLISVITLAGAADEILGKLARLESRAPSLDRRVKYKLEMFEAIFPNHDPPSEKDFRDLSNKSRNAMKHLTTTEPIEVDLEERSGRLLARAVENYVLLFGKETAEMRKFQRRRLRGLYQHGMTW